jgi:predicted transcriptional regulator
MTETLSKRSRRSKSLLAAEAIAAKVRSEEWQLGELQAAIAELDSGHEVRHDKVSKWLKSWGTAAETKRSLGADRGFSRSSEMACKAIKITLS